MVSLDGDKDKCSRTMWRNSLDWLGRSVLQFFFKRRSYFSTEKRVRFFEWIKNVEFLMVETKILLVETID